MRKSFTFFTLLFLIGMSNVFADPCIVNIPDANFKYALVTNAAINTNSDSEIQCSEAAAFTGMINVYNRGISDLTGIEAFTALTSLSCIDNQLTSLNLSANTALINLYCYWNQLTSLNLSANTALKNVDCHHNQISSLYFSSNSVLTNLRCNDNQISSLNLSSNTALTWLECGANQLTSLDISADTALTHLSCGWNQLTNLNFSDCMTLTYLECSWNQLTSLNISVNTALTTLYCSDNKLTSLNLSTNTALTYLDCSYNRLTSLNFSANTALATLYCNGNQLTSLNLSANTALTHLNCSYNLLTSLNLSANLALTYLECYNNQLSSLNISHSTVLTYLRCTDNQLTSLNLSINTALNDLYCYNNQLTSLDLSANTALVNLNCCVNQLTSLNVKNGNNIHFSWFNAQINPNLTCIQVDNAAWSTAHWTIIDAGASYSEDCNPCTPTSSSQTVVECAGFFVTVGTNTYNTTGIYTDILTGYNACDSTVTTNLTIKQPTTSLQTFVECAGFSVIVGTNTYNTTGIYTDIFNGSNGCDSTVTTNLTVNSILVASSTAGTVLCNGNNTVITVSGSGGTPPYSGTGNFIVSSGLYNYIVTDANGCIANTNAEVNWTGPCDTKVRTTDCGSTVNTLAKYIYCDAVSGATDYEWEFSSTDFSFTKTKGNNSTGFYLAWVTGIEFEKTYNVRVRAYKYGVWGNFSTVCQITTGSFPSTKLRADFCGTTVSTMNKFLYCDVVYGAIDYEWEFTNSESAYSFIKTRTFASNSMYLSWIIGLEYEKTYNVRVRAKVGTQWGSFGNECQITTPALQTTKLRSDYCGIIATSFTQYLYCDAITGATIYEWTFANPANNFSFTDTKTSTAFNLSWVTGLEFGITYNVCIRAKVGNQWSNFGNICQITTLAFPTTKVRSTYCGITLTSFTQYFYCDVVRNAVDYEWEFVESVSGTTITKNRGSNSPSMNLNLVTGMQNGKTYNVRVRAKIGNQWGSFGMSCQISTPVISVQKSIEEWNIEQSKLKAQGSNLENRTSIIQLSLMPNPVRKENAFILTMQSDKKLNDCKINIYNIIGQVIYTKQLNIDTDNYLLNIEQNEKFSSGLFIIHVELNREVKRLKLIIE